MSQALQKSDRSHLLPFPCPLMQSLCHRKPLGWSGRTCFWWSFQEVRFLDLPRHRGETDRLVVSRIVFFTLFKNGGNISLFPVTGDFTWLPWLFWYHAEWFCNCISQFPLEFGMHLTRSHGLVYVQIPQIVLNLVVSCDRRAFNLPVLSWFSGSGEM